MTTETEVGEILSEEKHKRCALCQRSKKLNISHIIPKFAVSWLKETSVTGKLRTPLRPNIRFQDGYKLQLLCRDCEGRFSVYEKRFAEDIFTPIADYIENKISEMPQAFKYDEWLLKFVVSVQWRQTILEHNRESGLSIKQIKILGEAEQNWRNYLLGSTPTTGIGEHHLMFLQSMEGAKIGSDVRVAENVNLYILRTLDGTVAHNRKGLWVYSKIGPMVLLTSLIPEKLFGCNSCRIHKKGQIRTRQTVGNGEVGTFIFRTRVNEAFGNYNPSEKQRNLMDAEYRKNAEKLKGSSTLKAHMLDEELKRRGIIKMPNGNEPGRR